MKNLFITKSRECRSNLFKGHASKPYCVSFALLIIDFIVILHVRLIRVLLKISQSGTVPTPDRHIAVFRL